MASRTVKTGSASFGRAQTLPNYGSPYFPSPGSTASATNHTTTAAEMNIFGGDYSYTVRDLGGGLLIRRPCRYKGILVLLDAEGTECRAEVMTQEHLPADLKAPAPAAPKE